MRQSVGQANEFLIGKAAADQAHVGELPRGLRYAQRELLARPLELRRAAQAPLLASEAQGFEHASLF